MRNTDASFCHIARLGLMLLAFRIFNNTEFSINMIDKLNDRDRSRLIEKKSDFLTMYDWE